MLLSVFVSPWFGFAATAQPVSRYNAFSYSVNEGLLQTTIGDIAVDKANYCWISFPNGIQKFDGKTFTHIPVQAGLPDDKSAKFFRCANGDLLVSHAGGISRYMAENNRFQLIYATPKASMRPLSFIGEDENVIYFFTSDAAVVGLNNSTFQQVSVTPTNMPSLKASPDNRPLISNPASHRVAFIIKNTVYLWHLTKRQVEAKYSSPVEVESFTCYLSNAGEVIFNTFHGSYRWMRYDFRTSVARPFDPGVPVSNANRVIMLEWKGQRLLSVANRLFLADTAWRVKSEMLNFLNEPFTLTNSFHKIKADNFGNLYLTTVMGGIVKIIGNNYPVKYYGVAERSQNRIMSILPDKESNRILAGTSNGLLIFDTMQRLVHRLSGLPGKSGNVAFNAIAKNKDGSYLLSFSGSNSGIYRLAKDLASLTPVALRPTPGTKPGSGYFGNLLHCDDTSTVMQSQGYLFRVPAKGGHGLMHLFSTGYVLSGLWYKNKIIVHAFDELIFLHASNFNEMQRLPLPNTGDVRCYAADNKGRIYMGTNNGIFVLDETGKLLQKHTRATGLPDNCIYALAFDREGLLWCSSNKGLFRLNKDSSVLLLTKNDGLQENEFNTNAVARANDGELFFGGVNGISSFYPSAINRYEDKPSVLLTGLKMNNKEYDGDSAVWALQKLILPFDRNSFAFDFTAMGAFNPDQYIYQYRMDGVDKEWIQATGPQTARYQLQPGTYAFQLYAARQADAKAKPLKQLLIIIKPPFWKTWWFRAVVAVAGVWLLAFVINQQTRQNFEKRLQGLEAERRLKMERERISKDLHDSIGAYANAVLYDIELLEKEKEEARKTALISELKFASKDIITSLRETVWALKKEVYTAEECFVRIRNFIQPLSRHYSHIHFKVEGEAPAMDLHYTGALNLVRIVQEAVSNSIKHANAANILVTAAMEQKRWKLTVSDDGRGFDYALEKEKAEGNGLHNMASRAVASGFQFSVWSNKGKGTRIAVLV